MARRKAKDEEAGGLPPHLARFRREDWMDAREPWWGEEQWLRAEWQARLRFMSERRHYIEAHGIDDDNEDGRSVLRRTP